jgi:hypothetical protein
MCFHDPVLKKKKIWDQGEIVEETELFERDEGCVFICLRGSKIQVMNKMQVTTQKTERFRYLRHNSLERCQSQKRLRLHWNLTMEIVRNWDCSDVDNAVHRGRLLTPSVRHEGTRDSHRRFFSPFFCLCLLWIHEAKGNIKPIYECRCNERLINKWFTRLSDTGLVVVLEHLKIKTRLTREKFSSVKGEREI